jgi:hypothetical protein
MRLSSILVMLLLASGLATGEERTYHKIKPSECVTTKWTHVEMVGKVTLVKKEGDGDIHIRVDDEKGFCVAEIIPSLSDKLVKHGTNIELVAIRRPKVGETITVRGISRVDKTHGWGEIHPVESIE